MLLQIGASYSLVSYATSISPSFRSFFFFISTHIIYSRATKIVYENNTHISIS
jgi:hypothetical protein